MGDMSRIHTRDLDLNLLSVFDAIMKDRNVTLAGVNSVRNRNDGLTRMRCNASSSPWSNVPDARPSL